MTNSSNPLSTRSFVLAMILIAGLLNTTGCAANKVKSGDVIRLHYTCRLADGAIATTTENELVDDSHAIKASFFYPSNKNGAVRMFPGQAGSVNTHRNLKMFEPEVRDKLNEKVIGLPYDRASQVTITSTVSAALEKNNRYTNIRRVRTRPVFQKIGLEQYARGRREDPAVGQRLIQDGQAWAEVVAVDSDEVTIKILADTTPVVVETPWGKAIAKRKGDRVESVLDAQLGHIVRTGGALGRITEVNDTHLVVDYGHPFAYEKLSCEVTPERFVELDPKE